MDKNQKLILITIFFCLLVVFEQYSKTIILKNSDIYTVLFIDSIVYFLLIIPFILYNKNINSILDDINNIDYNTHLLNLLGILFITLNVISDTYLIKNYDMKSVGLYDTISKIFFTIIFSIFLLKEDYNADELLGYLIILFGFFIVYKKNGN